MMDLNENFRKNLLNLMLDRGISRTQTALQAGVALDHFLSFLKGKNGMTLRTVAKMCENLKVDPIAMMEE